MLLYHWITRGEGELKFELFKLEFVSIKSHLQSIVLVEPLWMCRMKTRARIK